MTEPNKFGDMEPGSIRFIPREALGGDGQPPPSELIPDATATELRAKLARVAAMLLKRFGVVPRSE